VLEPRFAEGLMGATSVQVDKMMKHSLVPVLLCAPELRRHLRTLTERVLPHLRIISLSEIPGNVGLRSYGTVSVPGQGT
jgi:flagellar biosynthesis protein FlhA